MFMNFSLWRVKHANKCTKALKMPFPQRSPPLFGLCRTNKQSEMGIKYGQIGRQQRQWQTATTLGNFVPFFLSLSLFLVRSRSLFVFCFFFFCLPKGVSRSAGAVLVGACPFNAAASATHEYLCKTLIRPVVRFTSAVAPFASVVAPVPSRPRLLGVFSYCWLRYAKCALMHFTTLYGTFPGGTGTGTARRRSGKCKLWQIDENMHMWLWLRLRLRLWLHAA